MATGGPQQLIKGVRGLTRIVEALVDAGAQQPAGDHALVVVVVSQSPEQLDPALPFAVARSDGGDRLGYLGARPWHARLQLSVRARGCFSAGIAARPPADRPSAGACAAVLCSAARAAIFAPP
jgi:hypothetical protein